MRVVNFFLLLIFSLSGIGQDRPFITTWKTDNQGGSCDSCIEIPAIGIGYEYEVDWDMDGIYDEQGITGLASHDYMTRGTYTIAIRGDFPRIAFNSPGSDSKKLISIDQWGDIKWEQFRFTFSGCRNMDIEASDTPDLSAVADMSYMFEDATSLTDGLENWDVSFVKNMSHLFSGANSFNGDLSDWDVSSVEDMSFMFKDAVSMIGSLKRWDVSSVINMSEMFFGASNFVGDISRWDVSSVINMESAFRDAVDFEVDISSWEVSSVVNMDHLFSGATSFNLDLSMWDVSSVTGMWSMFRNATSYNQDVSTWDVSSVSTMGYMFSGATSFNQDLSSWDVNSLSGMAGLWGMLGDCGMDSHNYDSTLAGWAANPSTPDGLMLSSGGLEYCDETGRDLLLIKGWSITGDSQSEDVDCITTTQDISLEDSPYLYPMPAHKEIHIASLYETGNYIIYNRFGKTVSEGSYHPDKAIKIQHLPDGIFYLVVEIEDIRYPFVITKMN